MIPGQEPAAENPSKEYAPQNGYRSYQPESVFSDSKDFNSSMTIHERLPHAQVIARANGGTPNLDQVVSPQGSYQSDGK